MRRKIFFLIVVMVLSEILILPSGVNGGGPSEYEIKAAFLFNFAKFVEWPEQVFPNPYAPIIIGILGDDPFDSSLEQIIQNNKVKGRPFLIKRFRKIDHMQEGHILFIGESDKGHLLEVLRKIKNRPVLTVSDLEGFTSKGGMIRFFNEDKKIRFEINLEAAIQAGLNISSKLLKLAKIVKNETHK